MNISKLILLTSISIGTTAFGENVCYMGGNSIYNNNIITTPIIHNQDNTTYKLTLQNGLVVNIELYGNNIFRYFLDPNLGDVRNPKANPPADILVKNPKRNVGNINFNSNDKCYIITTDKLTIEINKEDGSLKVFSNNNLVINEIGCPKFSNNSFELNFNSSQGEYFYGGGVQNGRFSHAGKVIYIENQNSWIDGGVASPTPFFWSTKGYGMLFHTFKKGKYDFNSKGNWQINISHEDNYLDMFIMVSQKPEELLKDFYQLTGNPVLLPEFGFYQGHLNAYNRDYWKEDNKGILFEDGKKYKESQKDNGGIKESLNGENNNYQFSARAVIDRYIKDDMPLGWILPNDGYGAGYGQTETLDGNIQNLKQFGDYARSKGVQIGLWTQSDLHPKEGVSALLQRDIIKEVDIAGVRVLKTDVAWVGAGYSFGLNGVADVAEIMPKYGNNARPFIISLDGWAGTQRYASIWSGDQTGGNWEYIRFHIPTYIGSGLSGQPNICSDMDGIFGGQNPIVNIRDYQWKAFTLMQLNMDGWGRNPKYPQALGEVATSINRNYLKLKSKLLPYAYSIAHEAVTGKPSMRAMFIDYPNNYTYGINTQYQYLFGPNFIVAPIYQNTQADKDGNDIRNNIYLPEGQWIDFYNGDVYNGGFVLNNYPSPIWKLPVFVKNGAIIPLNNANNNVSEIKKDVRTIAFYPYKQSSFTLYEDDGTTTDYIKGKYATTLINSNVLNNNNIELNINKTEGSFNGQIVDKETFFVVNLESAPKSVKASCNGKNIKLKKAKTLQEFNAVPNTYYFDAKPQLNRFSTLNSAAAQVSIVKNPELLIHIDKVNTLTSNIKININGATLLTKGVELNKTGTITTPPIFNNSNIDKQPYSINLTWHTINNADYYEVIFNGMTYSHIVNNHLLFENLHPNTVYNFKLRAVNKDGASPWAEDNIKTSTDPFEWAIKGIKASCNVASQKGEELNKLFDFDINGSLWHTKYDTNAAVPCSLIMDLGSFNTLDKLIYVPRQDRGNGSITKATIYTSLNGTSWVKADSVAWNRDGKEKTFIFPNKIEARFIKLYVQEALNNFASGKEIYVFKVPNTPSYIPGDINLDGKVDINDITSYMNYTGLKQGDADFEGYVSKGDINGNGIIDIEDIATAVAAMNHYEDVDFNVEGKITIDYNKTALKKGDILNIIVNGHNLKDVNALGFALPYNKEDLEFIGIKNIELKSMENLSNNRLHTSKEMVLYPTFINLENTDGLNGNGKLFTIQFKALKNCTPNIKAQDIKLIDKNLHILLEN